MGLIKFTFFAILFSLTNTVHAQNFEIIGNEVTQVYNSLNDAFFLNDSIGFAVGGYGFGSGVIIKTTDYGNSWERTDVNHNLFSLIFLNDSVGYTVGESSTIMKTVDGGSTWIYQNVDIIAPSFQCRTIAFLNPDTGFVGTANGPGYAFLYTHNGGETWNNSEPGSVYGRAKLQKANDSTIYALPYDNKFYKSTDYGESWDTLVIPENTGSSRDMYFFSKDTGIVATREFSSTCGNNIFLSKTNDGGVSWTTDYFECEYFDNLTFPTKQVGYATGMSYLSIGERYMWRTLNGGLNWEEFEYQVGEEFEFVSCLATSFACVNKDTCYMPTNYGTIIKMTNASGGLSTVGDDDSKSANQLLIFPNPNNGNFTIKSDLNEIANIKIYSIDGKKVYEVDQVELGQHLQISVSNLSPGIYIYTIKAENEMFNGKFSKL